MFLRDLKNNIQIKNKKVSINGLIGNTQRHMISFGFKVEQPVKGTG